MYKKIKIEQFRGIEKLELNHLRQFNLFVGKNNCGKTSILESVFLLSGPTNVDLPVSINRFRGYDETDDHSWTLIFNKLDTTTPICFTGQTDSPKTKRKLTIKPLTVSETTFSKPGNGSLHFSLRGSATIRRERINGLSLSYTLSKTGSAKESHYNSEIRWIDGKFQKTFPFLVDTGINGLYINLRTDMGNSAQQYNDVQIKKQEGPILKTLQQVEPALIDLSIGADNILYCDIGLNKRLPVNALGEGFNRLLSIILAIYDSSGGILLIDEIENGLHYSAQEILWSAVFTAAETFNVQIFATTHSFENIKAYSSAYEKFAGSSDNLRLYRIEKNKEQLHLIDFDRHTLKTALESDWEVR